MVTRWHILGRLRMYWKRLCFESAIRITKTFFFLNLIIPSWYNHFHLAYVYRNIDTAHEQFSTWANMADKIAIYPLTSLSRQMGGAASCVITPNDEWARSCCNHARGEESIAISGGHTITEMRVIRWRVAIKIFLVYWFVFGILFVRKEYIKHSV